MIKINKEKLDRYGLTRANEKEVLSEIRYLVDWLERHNKNYTGLHNGTIADIRDFLKCFDVVEE